LRVVPEDAERPERAEGHRDLPVLAVLVAGGEVLAEVLEVRLEDLPNQLPQLGILEVLELTDLAVAERGQTPSWL
jgi:hypothetical protein